MANPALWAHIKQLKGETLRTLDQQKPFDIVDVDGSGMIICPQTTGKERRI